MILFSEVCVKKCGDFLRETRENQGLSQKDVSEAMGYNTSQFISNWERGLSLPPIPALRKLAKLYKIDADDLFNVILEAQVDLVTQSLKEKFGKEKTRSLNSRSSSMKSKTQRA
jgi:transcriptional regulator with XRE-family HTH domain